MKHRFVFVFRYWKWNVKERQIENTNIMLLLTSARSPPYRPCPTRSRGRSCRPAAWPGRACRTLTNERGVLRSRDRLSTNHSPPGGHGAGPAEPHADDAHGDVGGGVQRRRDGREEHGGDPHVDAGEEHGHVSRVTVRGHVTSVTLVQATARDSWPGLSDNSVSSQSRCSVIFRHVSEVWQCLEWEYKMVSTSTFSLKTAPTSALLSHFGHHSGRGAALVTNQESGAALETNQETADSRVGTMRTEELVLAD